MRVSRKASNYSVHVSCEALHLLMQDVASETERTKTVLLLVLVLGINKTALFLTLLL